MKKRKRRTSSHLDNLVALRETNPEAYARLGEQPRRAVESYEASRLAEAFEYRPGTERLAELRERLPRVYARFSPATKRVVEEYLEKKRARLLVDEQANGT